MHLRASGKFDLYSAVSRASGPAAGRLDDRPHGQLQVEAGHRFPENCAAAAAAAAEAAAAAGSESENVVGVVEKTFGGHCWRIAVEVEEVEGMKNGRPVDAGLMVEEGRIVEGQSLAR